MSGIIMEELETDMDSMLEAELSTKLESELSSRMSSSNSYRANGILDKVIVTSDRLEKLLSPSNEEKSVFLFVLSVHGIFIPVPQKSLFPQQCNCELWRPQRLPQKRWRSSHFVF
jgi:hypothetical protein